MVGCVIVDGMGLRQEGETTNEVETGADGQPCILAIVRGLPHRCWKCARDITCAVAIHTQDWSRSEDWRWFHDKAVLVLAKRLVQSAGRLFLADTIKTRHSNTAGGSYLSNGCEHCDALQGDWPLGEAVQSWVEGQPLCELPILAAQLISQKTWDHVAAHSLHKRIGYPVTWDHMR